MGRRLGAGALTLVVLAVIVVVALVPLLLVYRSQCPVGGGETKSRYSIVLPWNDPPGECRQHEQGIDIVL
ncbi:MAG TPA: hypothetical protein VGR10_06765 [Thermoleophilaceae bacterium]|nr:hypothetical protein [Thermoleophilaceae bacterium]